MVVLINLHAEKSGKAASSDQTIVAAGGDGTISTVAGELAATEKTRGVLPMGTLDHFAKDLRILLPNDTV
jgi:diacylglycerol kinase family enzyme